MNHSFSAHVQFLRETNISKLLKRTSTLAYQGVKSICFLEHFALTKWMTPRETFLYFLENYNRRSVFRFPANIYEVIFFQKKLAAFSLELFSGECFITSVEQGPKDIIHW